MQGPPGTGKTRTLLALLEVLARINAAPGRRQTMGPILACADTNAATDNLVEGLLARGIAVTRLGQAAKACKLSPAPLDYVCLSGALPGSLLNLARGGQSATGSCAAVVWGSAPAPCSHERRLQSLLWRVPRCARACARPRSRARRCRRRRASRYDRHTPVCPMLRKTTRVPQWSADVCMDVSFMAAHAMPKQAQAMRGEAERLFADHRSRGGFAAGRAEGTPPEERAALRQLKKEGDLLWEQAGALVKAASESILSSSQVRGFVHVPMQESCLACKLTGQPPKARDDAWVHASGNRMRGMMAGALAMLGGLRGSAWCLSQKHPLHAALHHAAPASDTPMAAWGVVHAGA